MKIPLANAIFDGKININKFYKENNSTIFDNMIFKRVDRKIFPAKIKKINQYFSSPIIINASNEVLVDHFLKKKYNI